MTWPQVQIVDAPTDAATVLFDCNDGPSQVNHEEFSLGSPEPRGLGWSSRTITLPVETSGTRDVALARHSELSRVLLRRRFWLRVQMDALTDPTWFRVTDFAPGDLSFDHVYADRPNSDAWVSTATLTAHGFARGERITLGTFTINHDPAAATNPLRLVLDNVIGDAPAPLRLKVTSDTPVGRRWLWSCSAHDVDPGALVTQIGSASDDGWTAGADTSASTADAGMSGGYGRQVTFATDASMVTRLTKASVIPDGQFLVAVRIRRSDPTSVFRLRAGATSVPWVWTEPVSPETATGTGTMADWLVLGEVRSPAGLEMSPVDLGLGASPAVSLLIQAERVSGSGSMWFDAVKLIPTGEPFDRAHTLRTRAQAAALFGMMWDGEHETVVRLQLPTGALAGLDLSSGGWPRVAPGKVNVLTCLPNAGNAPDPAANSDDLTDAVTVEVSYQPLWLHLAAS